MIDIQLIQVERYLFFLVKSHYVSRGGWQAPQLLSDVRYFLGA